MNKKALLIVTLLILAFVFVKSNNSTPGESIKVGVISPITGSFAFAGEGANQAVILAAKHINQSGGILGKEVELVVEDGRCEGSSAVSAVQKLINVDKVDFILGGHCSTETIVIAPVAEKSKILVMASITSSPDVTMAGDYIFRNFPSSNYYSRVAAEEAIKRGYKKVASLYELKEFPEGVARVINDTFETADGEVVFSEGFSSESVDLKSLLLKIDQAKPDIISFTNQGPDTAIIFLKQMKELGLLDKYPVLGGATFINKSINEKSGGLIESSNIFTVDAYVDMERETSKVFYDSFVSEFGSFPDVNPYYITSSYDALFLMRDAIESCGSVDTECMKEFLYGVADWKGVGDISLTLDKYGDPIITLGVHYFDESGREIWEVIE